MKELASLPLIDVDLLRVGLHIHLDLGWLAHPFPLNNFKISTPEQISTIRSLGVRSVRYYPDRSDPEPAVAANDPVIGLVEAVVPAAPESAEAASERQHREALAAQREAIARCESRFAEAAAGCQRTIGLVKSQPAMAGAQALALAGDLIDGMHGADELTIRLLAGAAGDKSSVHAMNVAVLSLLLGRSFGLSHNELLDLGTGALMHDIGKLDVPMGLRHREPDFSAAENRAYEEHVSHGVAHAVRMGLSAGAQLVVGQHHEMADGSGFPHRLGSERTSVASRIVSMVNLYDNLCNPHRPAGALTPHEALSKMFAQAQSKFDTSMLGAFIKMMGVYPPGSPVQLTDDRFALVDSVNAARPLKPRVLVYDRHVPRERALIVDLESVPRLGIRRSFKPAQLPADALEYLAPRPRICYYFEAGIELRKPLECERISA